jgi:putative membrane protein
MRVLTFIVVLAILLLGISFAVLNANAVNMNYYFGIAHLPLSLLLIITLIIGVLLGLGAGLIMLFRAKLQNRKLSKQLASHSTVAK